MDYLPCALGSFKVRPKRSGRVHSKNSREDEYANRCGNKNQKKRAARHISPVPQSQNYPKGQQDFDYYPKQKILRRDKWEEHRIGYKQWREENYAKSDFNGCEQIPIRLHNLKNTKNKRTPQSRGPFIT